MLRSLHLPARQSTAFLRFLYPTCHPIVRCSRPLTTRNAPQVDLVASDAQRRTIYALSTPPGKGGIAVIRISGPDALLVWDSMVRTPKKKKVPEPWKMERCRIFHPYIQSDPLDDGLAVYFKGLHVSDASADVLVLRSTLIQDHGHSRPRTLWNCICTLGVPSSHPC